MFFFWWVHRLTLTSATVSINSEGKASIAFIESSDLDAPILKVGLAACCPLIWFPLGWAQPSRSEFWLVWSFFCFDCAVMTWEVVAVEGSRVLMNVTDLLRDENTFIRVRSSSALTPQFTSTLGAVSKYSLNGVVGDSFNITAPTAGLYNVQVGRGYRHEYWCVCHDLGMYQSALWAGFAPRGECCLLRGSCLTIQLKEIPYIIEVWGVSFSSRVDTLLVCTSLKNRFL